MIKNHFRQGQDQIPTNRLVLALAILSFGLTLAALIITLNHALVSGDLSSLLTHTVFLGPVGIAFTILGALVASRHHQNPIGWIFLIEGLLYTLTLIFGIYNDLGSLLSTGGPPPEAALVNWLSSWIWVPPIILPTTFLFLLFPNGTLPSPRWRPVFWAAILGLILSSLGEAIHRDSINGPTVLLDLLSTVGFLLVLVGLGGGAVAFGIRFRRSKGAEREQVKWLAYALAMVLLLLVVGSVVWYVLPNSTLVEELSIVMTNIAILGIAVGASVAILRYRLYDIDLIINRTLVYGILTIGVLALYAFIVGGMGLLFRTEENIILPLLATGLTAVLFHPLRLRLQRHINHFMYGERDEPFDVMARLGERLENTFSPEMVFPTIVETVSQALKLPYVAINIWQNGQWETAESYGKPVADPVVYPLTYQGQTVGQLVVARRTAIEAFDPADERILRNIARQAGAAVHSVQLVADLQQSRHQLVTAREEERRRLRRDLHDGLGPQLASQTLTIDAIDKLLARDPERARALLQDLKKQSKTAVQDIRRLVYNLRPPALDELGLVGALNEGAARQSQDGLLVTVDAPERLPPLPAAIEVAAYRVAQEAITNVVRHAKAQTCFVRLGLNDQGENRQLLVQVKDDGWGLPEDCYAGVGFQSMRERASELGGSFSIGASDVGGVSVTAVFPLPAA